MQAIVDIPDFLLSEQEIKQRSALALRELTDTQYGIAFEHVLVHLAEGMTLTAILAEYHTPIEPAKFRQWMERDKTRKNRYQEARALGMEAIEDELIRISDGLNDPNMLPEDVQRSKLRIDTRLRVMGFNNKKYKEKSESHNGFSGGVNIVIAGVESPYIKADVVETSHQLVIDGELTDER